jgi:hypothetical protein
VDRGGRHADGVHGIDDPDRDLSAIGHENGGHDTPQAIDTNVKVQSSTG